MFVQVFVLVSFTENWTRSLTRTGGVQRYLQSNLKAEGASRLFKIDVKHLRQQTSAQELESDSTAVQPIRNKRSLQAQKSNQTERKKGIAKQAEQQDL